ncbi:TetR/AcrR family transcriptional regulator [soil metagenome]
MGLTVPYEQTGRVNQKARTREALIAAARELLSQGINPTMEGAAAAASISRTTAYRYFPSLRALLVATYPHFEERSLLGPDPPEDPAERLEVVAEAITSRILAHEAEMRAALRMSLEGVRPPELPMHQGLRVDWIEDALLPLQGEIAGDQFRRLTYGVAATLGIETFTWLTDIAQLSREEAAAVMSSNASRLLSSALADAAGVPGSRSAQ